MRNNKGPSLKSLVTKSRKPPSSEQVPEEHRTYDFSVQVGHLLRRAYQRHMAIFQRLNLDPQLTSVQLGALCALRDHGASSLTFLGCATGTDHATTRGVVERLKERDLLMFSSDVNDQRKVIVDLSPEGRSLVNRMIPVAIEINKLTAERLNPAEQVALVYLLKKLNDIDLEEVPQEPVPLRETDGPKPRLRSQK